MYVEYVLNMITNLLNYIFFIRLCDLFQASFKIPTAAPATYSPTPNVPCTDTYPYTDGYNCAQQVDAINYAFSCYHTYTTHKYMYTHIHTSNFYCFRLNL
jgi:hypothetical protein